MKNLIKSILVSMLLIGQLYAMDEGGSSGIPTVQTQPMVKIKTNDDKIFEMPQSEAEKIPVIEGCLGSCEVAPSNAIPLGKVSSEVFQQLRDDFRRIEDNINLDVSEEDRGNAAYELARNLPKAEYSEAVLNEKIALLKAADFLVWPELKQMYAKQVADMLVSDQFLSRLQQGGKEAIALVDSFPGVIAVDIARYMPMYICGSGEIATVPHNERVISAEFSPDGSKVVTASDDGTAKIFDAETGAVLGTIKHDGWVRSAVFSPDGSKVVTASDDRTAKIVNAQTGVVLATIQHDDEVGSAVFLPDGSKVVTQCRQTTKIVDAQTGAEIQTIKHDVSLLFGIPLVLDSAVISPDGSKVMTVSDDRTAKVFGEISLIDLNEDTGIAMQQLLLVQMLRKAQIKETGWVQRVVSMLYRKQNEKIQATGWVQKVVNTLNAKQRNCLKDLLKAHGLTPQPVGLAEGITEQRVPSGVVGRSLDGIKK